MKPAPTSSADARAAMVSNAVKVGAQDAAEFAASMHDIARFSAIDPESAHVNADKLMCALLTRLGYGVGVKIFETNLIKWYA